MMHSYLFEPGVWTSKGTFWRGDGEPLETQGRTEIVHHSTLWVLSGSLKVLGSPPVEFVNAYSITPPGRDGSCMKAGRLFRGSIPRNPAPGRAA